MLTAKQTATARRAIKDRLAGGYGPGTLAMTVGYYLRRERVVEQFEKLESLGLVRLRLEPDEHHDWDDLEGDCYDVEVNGASVPGGERTILAQQKEFRRRVELDGVWGIISEFRTNPRLEYRNDSTGRVDDNDVWVWETEDGQHAFMTGDDWEAANSCWGFAAYNDPADPYENEYVVDAMEAAITGLKDQIRASRVRCPRCGKVFSKK